MTRILVIGGSGFIGGHVALRLSDLDDVEVVTTTRRLGATRLGADLRLDLTDSPEAVAAVLRRVEPRIVVNCAGAVAGDPESIAAANFAGPANLVKAIMTLRSGTRLVHLGSAAEYGPVTEGVSLRENHPERPVGAYGVMKLATTRMIRTLVEGGGLDAVVLRVFSPIGPGAPTTTLAGHLAEEIHRAAAMGAGLPGAAIGGTADFVDVRDVAAAVADAAMADWLPAVLNVGSGSAVPIGTLVRGLVDAGGFGARAAAPTVSVSSTSSTLSTSYAAHRTVVGPAMPGRSLTQRTTSSCTRPGPQTRRAPGRTAEGAPGMPGETMPGLPADIGAITAALEWRPERSMATSLRDFWFAIACAS